MKVSDHWVRSPLLNVSRACQVCHPYPEAEIQARVAAIQDRTHALLERSATAAMDMLDAIVAAKKSGAAAGRLQAALDLQRKAQWRSTSSPPKLDGLPRAPAETARILANRMARAARPSGRRGQSCECSPRLHHHERSHHAGLGVIEDVAVEHPHARTIVVTDDEADGAVDGDVDRVLPFERHGRPARRPGRRSRAGGRGARNSNVFVIVQTCVSPTSAISGSESLNGDTVDAELERRAPGTSATGRSAWRLRSDSGAIARWMSRQRRGVSARAPSSRTANRSWGGRLNVLP